MRRNLFLFVLLFFSTIELSSQTILQPGDLALVGLASNVGQCPQGANDNTRGRDLISFICFKDIEPGTVIDITDNGWERAMPGMWGNTEGFVRITRTGGTIPAGTVITFELPPSKNEPFVAVEPDADWNLEQLGANALNFNDGGDQIYFLQDGVWDEGTTQCCVTGLHDATYSGKILFGFNSTTVWESLADDSGDSGLHPDIQPCFNMAPTSGVTGFTKYDGPMGETSQLEWISRISDPNNWVSFDDCQAYIDAGQFASIQLGPNNMAISCSRCISCDAFGDVLTFTLPDVGGPFIVEYTDGQDTVRAPGFINGRDIPVFVNENTTFELVSVTSANGCPIYSNFDGSATLLVDGGLTINRIQEQSATCSGINTGIIEIEISGGVEPYTIDWNLNILDGQTLATDLAAGEYTVVVRDADGCAVGDTITILQNIPLEVNCSVSQAPSGPNANDGSISIEVIGGGMPYDLTWVGPRNQNGVMTDNVSNPIGITGLSEGTYDITITDDNGCSIPCSVVIGDVECNLAIELNKVDPGCDPPNSGSIAVTLSGENGTNIDYDWADININGQSNPMSLIAGPYKVRVTDSANCMAEDSIILVAPEDPIINCTVVNNVSTVGGSDGRIRFNIPSSGAPPFKLEWINPATLMADSLVDITTIPFEISTFPPGDYEFILTDANGCTANCITDIIGANCTLELNLRIDQSPTCDELNFGRIEAEINGAVGSVSTFDWNIDSLDGQQQVAGLEPGIYILTIADESGCTAVDTVEFADFNPPTINCQIITQPSMGGNDGSASLEITGGNPPFQIALTGPTVLNLTSDGSTSTIGFSNLEEGVYTVQVQDAVMCTLECTLVMGEPECTLQLSFDSTNPDCFDPQSGAITPIVRGARGPVIFDWNADSLNGQEILDRLSSGTYVLTVIDSTNCSLTDSITLAVDTDISLECETVSDESIMGASDGIGQLTITGGQIPFQITWNNGTDSLMGSLDDVRVGLVLLEDLPAGIYQVNVTDAVGCSAPCAFTIGRNTADNCTINLTGNGLRSKL